MTFMGPEGGIPQLLSERSKHVKKVKRHAISIAFFLAFHVIAVILVSDFFFLLPEGINVRLFFTIPN